MEPTSRWLPLALVLALGSAVQAETLRLDGSWQLEGRNARGKYGGSVTLVQDSQGNVRGELALVYMRWSWLGFRYVPTSRVETAVLTARVEGSELVGQRRADGMNGVLEGSLPVRYKIAARPAPDEHGSRVESVSGSYGRALEQLTQHRPSGVDSAQRVHSADDLRAALAEATRGLVYVSRGQQPFQVLVVGDRAADYVRTVEDLKRELSIPAYRPGEEATLDGTLGKRAAHHPGESPAEAALADRFAALIRLMGERLEDVRAYRVAGPDATVDRDGRLVGAVDVYILGRTRYGDLLGLRTVSVE